MSIMRADWTFRRALRWAMIVGVSGLGVLLLAGLTLRAQFDNAVDKCQLAIPSEPELFEFGVDWDSWPPGFHCSYIYEDGTTDVIDYGLIP